MRSVFDLLALLRQLEVIRESKVQIDDRSNLVDDNTADKRMKLSQTMEERAGEWKSNSLHVRFRVDVLLERLLRLKHPVEAVVVALGAVLQHRLSDMTVEWSREGKQLLDARRVDLVKGGDVGRGVDVGWGLEELCREAPCQACKRRAQQIER